MATGASLDAPVGEIFKTLSDLFEQGPTPALALEAFWSRRQLATESVDTYAEALRELVLRAFSNESPGRREMEEAVKRLAIIDGRNEKEFVRNLLSALLGYSLCLSFCWAAIRKHAAFSGCKSAIDWFHGTRDRYGGRAKRRDNTTKLPVCTITAAPYPAMSPSKDTEPATDKDVHA
ncbi:hypothetical protein SprV_0401699000 [Sparganum proliferum]